MYPHYHTHISTSSNTCIHFIEYVYSHHRTRISFPHFVGIYVHAGTINRTPTAANGLPITWRTLRKHSTPTHETPQNTPPGVGADSSRPYPNITKHVFPHYQIRISLPHFVCIFLYAGTINRTPTAANGLPITWRTLRKHSTPTHEKPYFRTTKTYFSQRKNPLLALQKPTFRTAKTYLRQIGRVAKTFC